MATMRAFLLATLVGTALAFSPAVVGRGAMVAHSDRSSVVSRMVGGRKSKRALTLRC